MKHKILLFISSSILCAACAAPSTPSPTPESPTSTPVTESVQQVDTASQQIATAFANGGSLKCNVITNQEGSTNSIYLIKDKKMRMETEPHPETGFQYFSINDGNSIYLWSTDPSTPGITMTLAEVKKAQDSFDNQFQNFPDLSDEGVRQEIEDQGYQITCAPGEIADSEFVPPSDVTFTSLSEMFKGMLER